VKTTIIVPDSLYEQFSRATFQQTKKNRMMNVVIRELIRGYVEGRFEVEA
jgi:hypothetical protein